MLISLLGMTMLFSVQKLFFEGFPEYSEAILEGVLDIGFYFSFCEAEDSYIISETNDQTQKNDRTYPDEKGETE